MAPEGNPAAPDPHASADAAVDLLLDGLVDRNLGLTPRGRRALA